MESKGSPRKKQCKSRVCQHDLGDEKLKEIHHYNTLSELYAKNNQDLRCCGPEMDIVVSNLRLICAMMAGFQSDFVSQQCFAEYTNYHQAINRSWKYFRSGSWNRPQEKLALQKMADLQKQTNQLLEIAITKLEEEQKKLCPKILASCLEEGDKTE